MLVQLKSHLILAFTLIVFLSGCASNVVKPKVNHAVSADVLEQKLKTSKVVMLPPMIEVHELSAMGATEKDPEMTQDALENVSLVLDEIFKANVKTADFNKIDLTPEQKDLLREYVGLYDVVSNSAHFHTAGRGTGDNTSYWAHKVQHFDYTVGDGISFLREYTDADYALFVSGQDYVSSGGRVATFIFFAALGVAIPMGYSYLSAGVVDLKTGDISWLDYSASGSINLSDHEQTSDLVKMLFDDYPGMPKFASKKDTNIL